MTASRPLGVLATLLLLAGACETTTVTASTPSPTATPAAPSASATPTGSPSPAGSPKVEASTIVLDLTVGPGYEQPAATTPGVGGLSSRGPMSVAVDNGGRIYLWDHARARILVCEGGKVTRVLPEPFVDWGSFGLLAYAGRLYLRYGIDQTQAEYAIDASTGELVAVAASGLYPRERRPFRSVDIKGPQPPTGFDLLRNDYRPASTPKGYEVQRVDRTGNVTAIGTGADPREEDVVDMYVTGDGAVYELRHGYTNGLVTRVRVAKIMSAAGSPPIETPATLAGPAMFAGREAPESIDVTSAPELPPARLRGAEARSLWSLLALSRPATGFPPPGAPSARAYRMTAAWPDGSTMPIVIDSTLITAGTSVVLRTIQLEEALPLVIGQPRYLIDALRTYGARVRIPDLTGVERALTSAEVNAYAEALGSAFVTSFYERYRPLEDPFPIRQLTIAYPDGTVVLQDVGDRYLRNAAMNRGAGAWVHDGRASTLLRQWLPTPSISSDDPAILFTAEKVTLPDQDISRWKASIVRELLAPSRGDKSSWDDQPPLVFTFTLPGARSEVVRVDTAGFTFAGKTYAKKGLMDLFGLKGVP